jgi:two-component sensor histidine kinase
VTGCWVETGGPPIAGPPRRRGFGTRLLERALARDLGPGAAVELRFQPAGLYAAIRFAPGGNAAVAVDRRAVREEAGSGRQE